MKWFDRKILGSAAATASWMYRQISGYRIPVSASVLLGMIRIAASLSFIWVSKEMIDTAVRSDGSLMRYVVMLVLTLAVEMLCSVAQGYIDVRTEARVRNELRCRVFDKALNARWNGKEKWHTGDVVNRLEEDVRVIADTLCHLVPGAFITLFQLVAAFIFLWSMNPVLAWVILCILPVFLVLAAIMARRIKKLTADIRKSDSQVQSVLQESLQKRIVIIALSRVGYVMNRLVSSQNMLMEKVMKRNRFSMSSRAVIMVGFGAGYLTAFIWGVHRMQEGVVTFGMLSAFLQLVGQIQRPTADMSRRLPAMVHAIASGERLMEVYNAEQEDEAVKEDAPVFKSDGIKLENVTFGYPDGKRKILQNFTYDFRPGSITSVTGETGAGKSTMVRLALALLSPDEGSVTIYDGEKEAAASPLTRCNITYVPQGNSLISGTIRENLLLGNPNADEAEMKEALHNAAADFIQELPLGLDTVCGESGTGLSEGQAQRIAIARGLLRGGRIMLLDEPASALDNATEAILMERLKEGAAGRTIIMITHREGAAGLCEGNIEIK